MMLRHVLPFECVDDQLTAGLGNEQWEEVAQLHVRLHEIREVLVLRIHEEIAAHMNVEPATRREHANGRRCVRVALCIAGHLRRQSARYPAEDLSDALLVIDGVAK